MSFAPIWENARDRAKQRIAAEAIEVLWDCRVELMPWGCALDGICWRGEEKSAAVEIKCYTKPLGDDAVLSRNKVIASYLIKPQPTFLVIMEPDGTLHWTKLRELEQYRVKSWYRGNHGPDKKHPDVCAVIPRNEFRTSSRVRGAVEKLPQYLAEETARTSAQQTAS